MRFLLLFCLLPLVGLSQISLKLQQVASGLQGPVALADPGDGSGNLFVVEQAGQIRLIHQNKLVEAPFLDLKAALATISPFYSEMGLLGLAFHPKYKSNGRFYVYYSAPKGEKGSDHQSLLASYQRDPANPLKALANSGKVVLKIDQPASNHNGGTLKFGPDGMLYLGLGDGGGGGDRFGNIGNGQNKETLLGKIIRIDVNKTPYGIPADNPFVGKAGRDEIYAYGLRNPWKFSFDARGRLWCADVGQNKWEEVNLIEKGGNYGWRIMEGNHCFNPETNCDTRGLKMPVYEYNHSTGMVSVIGGYFYRGTQVAALKNRYFFGDWKGDLMFLQAKGTGWEMLTVSLKDQKTAGYINSFGEDATGEVYILSQTQMGPKNRTGSVWKVVE